MVIETNISLIFWNTLGGIIQSLPYFFLILLGFRMVAREIKEGVKNIPNWINLFFTEMQKAKTLDKALMRRIP